MCHTVASVCIHTWAQILAAGFTTVACVSSFVLICRHLQHNRHPQLRTLTVRILLMVPIYAVQAFCSLVLQVRAELTSQLLHSFREAYEAIVIFSVLQFVMVCVGGHRAIMYHGSAPKAEAGASAVSEETVTASAEEDSSIPHAWPMNYCLPNWTQLRGMAKWCVRCTLPYVVTGWVCAVLQLFVWLATAGKPGRALTTLIDIWNWILFGASCFAITALYELLHGLQHRLEGLHPWSKLVAVKLVIFFTFYQELVIGELLGRTTLFHAFIDEEHGWSSAVIIARGVNNFLLCVEMAIAATAHFYAFPADDYQQVLANRGVFLDSGSEPRRTSFKEFCSIALSFGDAVKYRDIFSTAWDAGMPKRMKRKSNLPEGTAASRPESTGRRGQAAEETGCRQEEEPQLFRLSAEDVVAV
eukprot:TRINITY_DN76042_c0_g1_i1.p1 TRINITY_DN76042_c0_g1~~TRINITY_DN76042_c0_g1_i1.p1  ORF type:complete len:414 (+),score=63.52 TRINITY_DN76042_c0_g1_i1:36-1277(+)